MEDETRVQVRVPRSIYAELRAEAKRAGVASVTAITAFLLNEALAARKAKRVREGK